MDYIFQKQYSLRNTPFVSLYGATVLLVEPEVESCAIYSRQMQGVNINVITCGRPEEMIKRAEREMPDVVIINPVANIPQSVRLVSAFKRQFPAIPVITLAPAIQEEQLDAIMNAGVSFHINRHLTQPRDLLLAIEQVLS